MSALDLPCNPMTEWPLATQAQLARLVAWACHGTPTEYGGSQLMRQDLRAALRALRLDEERKPV
jgi:hypothetical protein